MTATTNCQYLADTPDALAASLNSEFSTTSSSSRATELAAKCCQLISAHLGHVTGTETGDGRRALHVGCATGRITFELAGLFHQVSQLR